MVPKLVEKERGWTSTPRVAEQPHDVSRRATGSSRERHTDVLLLEFTSQVALQADRYQHAIPHDQDSDDPTYLDEGSFASTTVTDCNPSQDDIAVQTASMGAKDA